MRAIVPIRANLDVHCVGETGNALHTANVELYGGGAIHARGVLVRAKPQLVVLVGNEVACLVLALPAVLCPASHKGCDAGVRVQARNGKGTVSGRGIRSSVIAVGDYLAVGIGNAYEVRVL
jgi:hypothetical protein